MNYAGQNEFDIKASMISSGYWMHNSFKNHFQLIYITQAKRFFSFFDLVKLF